MTMKVESRRGKHCVMPLCALTAAGAFALMAETTIPWQFDTSARVGSVTAPTAGAARNATVWESVNGTVAHIDAIRSYGLQIIIK